MRIQSVYGWCCTAWIFVLGMALAAPRAAAQSAQCDVQVVAFVPEQAFAIPSTTAAKAVQRHWAYPVEPPAGATATATMQGERLLISFVAFN